LITQIYDGAIPGYIDIDVGPAEFNVFMNLAQINMGGVVVSAGIYVGDNEIGRIGLGQTETFTISADVIQGNIERVTLIGAG
jgi:hypothetical protein